MSAFLRTLRELVTREPVIIRTVITALVSIGLIWGLDFTELGNRLTETADLLGGLVAAIGLAWVRQGTSAAATVVATQEPSGAVVAGPASVKPTGQLIDPDEPTGSLVDSPRHMS